MAIRRIGTSRQAPPLRFGTLAYSSNVLQDSPWGYWRQQETSGTNLADLSGNGRTMTVNGSPTLAQGGPVAADGGKSILWPSGSGAYSITTATLNTTSITLEAWVYLSTNPSGNTPIVACASGYNSAAAEDKEMFLDSTGKVNFFIYTGSNVTVTASAALSLNAWHHVICSVGAAGAKIRVDKSTVGTNAATTSFSANYVVLTRAGGQRYSTTQSPVQIAEPAVYLSQLSDARTDSHYDTAS